MKRSAETDGKVATSTSGNTKLNDTDVGKTTAAASSAASSVASSATTHPVPVDVTSSAVPLDFPTRKSKKGEVLTSSNVYIRIRPIATEGGHADTGKRVAKLLSGWTDTSVSLETSYMFSKGKADE